jgi:hypothetical protein
MFYHHSGFFSPLFPDLQCRDAASILYSACENLSQHIIQQFGDSIREEFFCDSKWNLPSSFIKRFAGIFVDEAHLLRNSRSVATKSVLALSRSCCYRFVLTSTPFTNSIDDVASLAWLLGDEQPWSWLCWWKQLATGRERPSSDSCEVVNAWRQSVLLREKDAIAANLPALAENFVIVRASEAEKLYSATLYVKLQRSLKDYECDQTLGDNRVLAFQRVLSCLARLVQSTTHSLIVAGRGHTGHHSALSRAKLRTHCVHCSCADNEGILDSGFLRNEQIEQDAEQTPTTHASSSKNAGCQFEGSAVQSGEAVEAAQTRNSDSLTDDDEPLVTAPDDFDKQSSATALQPCSDVKLLPCGHGLCPACIDACTWDASPKCFYCRDMDKVGLKVSSEDIPTSSKLQALVEELITLPQ